MSWISKHRLFWAAALLLTARYALTLTSEQKNELDVLPGAHHAADPRWLAGDWYLRQPAPHRTLFSAVVGPLLRAWPTETVAVLGRCLTFVLFALAFQALARALALEALWALAALLAFLPLQTLVAGEWMVSAFETKPFAYAAAVAALSFLLRRRWGPAFFLFGCSLTLHLLVGLYATVCAGVVVLTEGRGFREHWRGWLRAVPGFAAGAALGGWLILEQLRSPAGEYSRRAAEIYVRFRNPHHLFLPFWIEHRHGLLSLALVAVLTIALGVIAATHRGEIRRRLAIFGLGSAGLFVIGLVAAAAQSFSLLQMYWFRFPSVVLPLVALLLLAVWLQSTAPERGVGFRRAAGIVVLLGAAATILQGLSASTPSPSALYTRGVLAERVAAQVWIRENAPREAVFLTDPYLDEFYVVAERARFVSVKHVPNSPPGVVEWYERLVQLNGGRAPLELGTRARAELQEGFRRLTAAQIVALACRYGLTHALLETRSDPFHGRGSEQELYRNGAYVVYALTSVSSCSSSSSFQE